MNYLKELCTDLNIDPDLKKSDTGFFTFPISEDLKIEVKPLDPGVYFYSPITACPKVKREDLFIYLMKGNLFGQGTMGGAIALSPDENLLTLSHALPYDMTYRDFRESLEDFANVVDYWREEVDRHVSEAEGGIL